MQVCPVTKSDIDKRLQNLIDKHLTEERWQNVFLFVTNLLPHPEVDKFFFKMKEQVDKLVQNDEKICSVLRWVEEKSNSVKTSYQPGALRVFYLAMAFEYTSEFDRIRDRDFDAFFDIYLSRTRTFAVNLANALDLELPPDLVLGLNSSSDLDRVFVLDSTLPPDLVLDLNFARTFTLANSFIHTLSLIRAFNSIGASDLVRCIDFNREFARTCKFTTTLIVAHKLAVKMTETALIQILQELKDKIPTKENCSEDWQKWTEELKGVMKTYQNLCHEFELECPQMELLSSYLYANNLLVECLKNECNVSKDTREKILNELLTVK